MARRPKKRGRINVQITAPVVIVGKKKNFEYPIELVMAVKYLMEKGITNSSEIAKRLEVSPFTVINIKKILKRLQRQQEEQQKQEEKVQVQEKQSVVSEKAKKDRDIIEEILGI